ncbi:MAG: sulfotransferase, partial [Acidobacteriota bacterium]|nr:sulfotransferase [Acidobacteriota bacterium]
MTPRHIGLRSVAGTWLRQCSIRAGSALRRFGGLDLTPKQPIFVVGCGRSGTTFLTGILNSHPRIADWSEANDLWDPTWYRGGTEPRERPPLELDPEAFTRDWWEKNKLRIPEISAAFAIYQRARGRDWFLNKSADHTFRISHLRSCFPEAY